MIQTHQLHKVYGAGIPAVNELSLTVSPGEIFGLLGPNGAGKTTTTGMLTGRVVPTSGQAWVKGIEVWTEPARVKRVLGVVSQTNTLDRALTVRENLVFHGRYFGMAKVAAAREADALLRHFGIVDRAHQNVASLSGGLAQRVMLARAVMHKPEVLFLDEPSTGLDPQSRLALWELLMDLNAQGQTVFLTTHYMEEAERLCHRVAIMDKGRLVALDSPAALKRSTGATTVITIIVDRIADGVEKRLHDSVPEGLSISLSPGKLQIGVENASGVLSIIVAAIEAEEMQIRDIAVAAPSLETVFLRLTGKAWH